MKLEEITVLVESSIEAYGLEPVNCRGEKAGKWSIPGEGRAVYVEVFTFPGNPDAHYLQFSCPLIVEPKMRQEEFYRNLLEINYDLYGCSISKSGDSFYIKSLKEAESYDKDEIVILLKRLVHYSSDYYGKLAFKYDGSWKLSEGESGE